MPFSELDDFHPYRSFSTEDGREFLHVFNEEYADRLSSAENDPVLAVMLKNDITIHGELVRLGVLHVPELPSYDKRGNEVEGDVAYYVDARLGREALRDLDIWVTEAVSLPSEDEIPPQRELSAVETRFVVGMALDELGISETLARMRREDAAKARTNGDPITSALRQINRLETDDPADDGPEHLAPEDLI